MTIWYVRPDTSHSATRTGTSYATAWGGWSAIVWGGAGVKAGDTLYVCGAHSIASAISIGNHGATVSSRVTISGGYEPDPGSITVSAPGGVFLQVNRNYTTLTDLTLTANTSNCLFLFATPPLTGVTIQRCTFHGGTGAAIINVSAANNQAHIDLTIDDSDFNGGSGSTLGGAINWVVAASGSPLSNLTRVTISNNRFNGCAAARAVIELRLEDGVNDNSNMADIVISDNVFRACKTLGMEIYGRPLGAGKQNTGLRITGNKFYDMTNTLAAFNIGGAMGVGGFSPSLTPGFGDNIIARNEGYRLSGPSGLLNLFYGTYRVFDNYGEDIVASQADGNGLLVDHGCWDTVLYSNRFRRVIGNPATENSGCGIMILDATNTTAYSNIVDGCKIGIYLGNKAAAQSSNVHNNTFLRCSYAGVHMLSTADKTSNLARNNIFTATGSAPSVRVAGTAWSGDAHNCFHGFASATGHTLAGTSVTIDPDLDDDYRPRSPYVKVGGTYLPATDFYGNQFSSPAPMGAVNDEAIVALSEPQQAELQKAVTRAVYFVQLEFASSTQYVCTANQTITWGGHDWLGFGTVGGISPIEESEGVESRALTFTLNVAQQSILALAVGSVEEYRGKTAKMYFCPLDESFQLVGTPQLCWRGIMDLMAIGVEGEEGKITLKCETSAYGLKRQPSLRLNAAQHKKRHPADTGFDFLTDLIANPSTWLSVKFQRSIH